jgi:glycosyltransferase involved in cell wall biosynthesis
MFADPPDRNGAVRRVLMTADGVGGVWTYALDLASGLRAHGTTVTIATMGPRLTEDRRADAARRGIDVHEGAFALEWMEDPWADVDAAAGWLLDLERRCRPDVVHLNGYCHGALPWRAPLVIAAHSCVGSWWRGVHGAAAPSSWNTYRERVRNGLASAAIVVAPTRAMLEALEREYGHVADGRVIPNGRAQTPTPTQPRDPIVFTAGRVWDRAKNIGAVCRVAPHVQWPICVAGDTRGTECPAPDVVHYLGHLSAAEMQTWFARASIYALPARYEPFGLSVLEAASAGCALVLGDIPSLRENWDGAAAFVDPDDEDALAAAINRLIDSPALCAAMGADARQRSERFTVNRMASAYAALYEELVCCRAPL